MAELHNANVLRRFDLDNPLLTERLLYSYLANVLQMFGEDSNIVMRDELVIQHIKDVSIQLHAYLGVERNIDGPGFQLAQRIMELITTSPTFQEQREIFKQREIENENNNP
jgi:hypothetical protein